MKKVLAVALSAVMGLSLAACGSSSSSTTAATTTAAAGSGETTVAETTTLSNEIGSEVEEEEINYDSELTVGIGADIGSFYPGGSGSAGVKIKRIMCYEPMFYKDAEGELHPIVAKEYEDMGNGTYQVTIFDYVTDSEGNKMTADDLVFSFDKYIEDGQNSSTWATITDYKAIDDVTFEFTIDPERTGQLEDILSRIPLVTQAAWEASGDDLASCPVGTGGYVLDTANSITGATYTFLRRDDYWQTDESYACDLNQFYLKKLTVKVYTDTSTLAAALETGEIDFTSEISSNDWAMFLNDDGSALDGYVSLEGQNNAFVHLMFNCADTVQGVKNPCADQNFREAICYAIDAAACAYQVYGEMGQQCWAPTNPYLEDSGEEFNYDEYFGYDADKAKELLAQTDYNGETIKILVLPRSSVSDSAVLIQNYCASIGINIELLTYDMSTFRAKRVETDPEYNIELLGATSADDYVSVSIKELDNRSYGNGMGRLMIEDDHLQELYEAISDQATNSPEAIQEIFDYLTDNCYIYGLYYCPKMLIGKDIVKHGVIVPFNDAIYQSFVIE